MVDMCGLLHGDEMAELYAPAASERLLHLAVVVDKYAFVDRLRPHTTAMLFSYLDEHQDPDHKNTYLDQLLAAAYLFHNQRCFRVISKRHMLETTLSQGTWPEQLSRDVLPERIMGKSTTVRTNTTDAAQTPSITSASSPSGRQPFGFPKSW